MDRKNLIKILKDMYLGNKDEYMTLVEKINAQDYLKVNIALQNMIYSEPFNENLLQAYENISPLFLDKVRIKNRNV